MGGGVISASTTLTAETAPGLSVAMGHSSVSVDICEIRALYADLTDDFGRRRMINYMERNSVTEYRRRRQHVLDSFWRSVFWWAVR